MSSQIETLLKATNRKNRNYKHKLYALAYVHLAYVSRP